MNWLDWSLAKLSTVTSYNQPFIFTSLYCGALEGTGYIYTSTGVPIGTFTRSCIRELILLQ